MNDYFDYAAATPTDKRVLDAMFAIANSNVFGNPSSRTHKYGWDAENILEEDRSKIANVLGVSPNEIIFTSGATEANNLAISGIINYNHKKVSKPNIVTSAIGHKSVINVALKVCPDTRLVKPDKYGIIDPQDIANQIDENTLLVSIEHVNSEIGTIQDIKEIGKICREKKVLFHVDAVQAVGKIPLCTDDVDLMSISAHKIYGPKGIGCLYKKNKVRLRPIMYGGDQENNMRPGTQSIILTRGFAIALELAAEDINNGIEIERLRKIRNMMHERISNIKYVTLHGHETKRVVTNLNYGFRFIEGEGLIMSLNGTAVSSGSACTSASLETSHVLRGIGADAHSSLRITFGRFTTEKDAMILCNNLINGVERLIDMSPLKEMFDKGIDLENYNWNYH